jgi:hypothetical protein
LATSWSRTCWGGSTILACWGGESDDCCKPERDDEPGRENDEEEGDSHSHDLPRYPATSRDLPRKSTPRDRQPDPNDQLEADDEPGTQDEGAAGGDDLPSRAIPRSPATSRENPRRGTGSRSRTTSWRRTMSLERRTRAQKGATTCHPALSRDLPRPPAKIRPAGPAAGPERPVGGGR